MLSEAWFMAAPRVCASPATSISRSCRFTTRTDPTTVIRNAGRIAHQPYGARTAKTSSTTPMPIEERSSVRRIDQSAMSPASQVPATMPSPRASRKTGTADRERPPTWVTMGAM